MDKSIDPRLVPHTAEEMKEFTIEKINELKEELIKSSFVSHFDIHGRSIKSLLSEEISKLPDCLRETFSLENMGQVHIIGTS